VENIDEEIREGLRQLSGGEEASVDLEFTRFDGQVGT